MDDKVSRKFGRLRAVAAAALLPTNVIGAIALVVVLASAIFADAQNRTLHEQQIRADVAREVGVLRARLEGNVRSSMQLVQGLVSTISTEPQLDQARFAALSRGLFGQKSQLRNIAAAPGLTIRLVYPMEGNEKILGLDYTKTPAQREAALRARDSRAVVFAGPLTLIQGGQGFIGRFPVFVDAGDGTSRFWGVVSAVVDADRLYADSGLKDSDPELEIGLRGRDGAGAGDVFFGDAAIFEDHPVLSDVTVPDGSWQLAARPAGGWAAAQPDPTGFRAGLVFAMALVLVPLFMARHLINERQRHIRALGEREHQLEVLSRRLGLALDTSEIGVWEYDIDTGTLAWDDRMNELYGLPQASPARRFAHWKRSLHPEDLARAHREFNDAISARGRYLSEFRVNLADGSERVIRAIGACYTDTDGTARLLGCNWDVTADIAIKRDLERAKALTEARNAELVAATARIEHNSLHDALTGLPNRRFLDRELGERAERANVRGGGVALLHIDLDRFKQINDTLGHAAGDAMLIHAARVLLANVQDGVFKDGKLHFAVSVAGRGGQKGGPPQTVTTTYEGAMQGGKFAMTATGGRGGRSGDFERSKAEAAMPPAKLPLPALHDVKDNKLARTPPMGWNSWNKFAGKIDDQAVRGVADAMVSSGMKKAGYIYVNIDDTWELGRDANGNITTNTKFPNMKALADYVHSKGLKIGIYSSPGPTTCAGYEASYGHEDQDAKTFASWGIDYLKYDWCSAGNIYGDEDMQAVYQKMGDALQKSGRPILYSLCQYGRNKVWEWGAKVGGNCWRTTGDINDSWGSLDRIGFGPAVPGGIRKQGEPAPPGLTQFDIVPGAAIGHWNDPDMLEVGNGHMTTDEYRTHFSLWCMLRAPLLAGNDLRDMTEDTKSILMNTDVIAIDQDPAGLPLKRISQEGTSVVYSRPLKGGDLAVALFNRGDQAADITVTMDSLGIAGKKLTAHDLWKHAPVTLSGDKYTASVPTHGVVLIRVTAK